MTDEERLYLWVMCPVFLFALSITLYRFEKAKKLSKNSKIQEGNQVIRDLTPEERGIFIKSVLFDLRNPGRRFLLLLVCGIIFVLCIFFFLKIGGHIR